MRPRIVRDVVAVGIGARAKRIMAGSVCHPYVGVEAYLDLFALFVCGQRGRERRKFHGGVLGTDALAHPHPLMQAGLQGESGPVAGGCGPLQAHTSTLRSLLRLMPVVWGTRSTHGSDPFSG